MLEHDLPEKSQPTQNSIFKALSFLCEKTKAEILP